MKYYFVYGALMGRGKFKSKGVAASLHDYRVSFSIVTRLKAEPAFATLVFAPGDVAQGVVAELTDAEWARLSRHEVGYTLRKVMVLTGEGGVVEAWTLFDDSVEDIPDVPPSSRYAKMLYKAAVWHGFEKEVVQRYYDYMIYGPKLSRYMRPFFPVVRYLAPYIHPRYTMVFLLYGLPVVCLIVMVLLLAWLIH